MKRSKTFVLSLLAVLLLASAVAGIASAESKIAFEIPSSSNPSINLSQIYVMNSDGSNVVRISDGTGNDFDPTWSPDGSRILFWSNRGTPTTGDFYSMRADGTDVVRVTNFQWDVALDWPESFEWSPEIGPAVAALTPFSQTAGVFLLGVIATLLASRWAPQQNA